MYFQRVLSSSASILCRNCARRVSISGGNNLAVCSSSLLAAGPEFSPRLNMEKVLQLRISESRGCESSGGLCDGVSVFYLCGHSWMCPRSEISAFLLTLIPARPL